MQAPSEPLCFKKIQKGIDVRVDDVLQLQMNFKIYTTI